VLATEGLADIFSNNAPIIKAVFVLGDTDSTVWGAELAKYYNIPLVHLEAGCRSGNAEQVEEKNRIFVDSLSDYLIAADQNALENLRKESYAEEKLLLLNNMGFYPLLRFLDKQEAVELDAGEAGKVGFKKSDKEADADFALMTIHRRELLGNSQAMHAFFENLEQISAEIPLFWPMHPHAKEKIAEYGLKIPTVIRILPLQSYGEMLSLLNKSRMVITDSGGLQEEAVFLGKPTLVARQETEWARHTREPFFKLAAPQKQEFVKISLDMWHSELHGVHKREDWRKNILAMAKHLVDKLDVS
jgi:UDP-N-acetylglucosamine 2-epimerase